MKAGDTVIRHDLQTGDETEILLATDIPESGKVIGVNGEIADLSECELLISVDIDTSIERLKQTALSNHMSRYLALEQLQAKGVRITAPDGKLGSDVDVSLDN